MALSALFLSPCHFDIRATVSYPSFLACRSSPGQARDHSCQRAVNSWVYQGHRAPPGHGCQRLWHLYAVEHPRGQSQSPARCTVRSTVAEASHGRMPQLPYLQTRTYQSQQDTTGTFSQLAHKATPRRTARLPVYLAEVQLSTVLVTAHTATGHLVLAHPEIRTAPNQLCERTKQHHFLQLLEVWQSNKGGRVRGHSACSTGNRGRKIYTRRASDASTSLRCSSYSTLQFDKRGNPRTWVRSGSRSKKRISRERGIVQWKARS